MTDRHKIENEVADVLAEARKKVMDASPDEGVEIRLREIEASLVALAVYLDKAFAEIRGDEVHVRGTS